MRVKVRVKPDSRREKFVQTKEGVFEASVKEPAENNQANRRVQKLLSDHFSKPVTSVRFITGTRSPTKIFEIV